MFNRHKGRFADMGKVKKTTEEIIDEAAAKHNRIAALWRRNRPSTPAVSAPVRAATASSPSAAKPVVEKKADSPASPKFEPYALDKPGIGGILSAYWFPISCAVVVLLLVIWAMWPAGNNSSEESLPLAPAVVMVDGQVVETADVATEDTAKEPTVQVIHERQLPEFDIVRIERNGSIIIAGRYLPQQNISIMMNRKIVATERTDANGEFVYAPAAPLKPGNYTIRLTAADQDAASKADVFLYIAENDPGRSLSLLMTPGGSKILQAPVLADGDLAVSKIDYLENGRIVVQGRAVPRLRVTLTLDGETIGTARTSDHKNFMLGSRAGEKKLTPGAKHSLAVRLHDGSGTIVAEVTHEFTMPEMTLGDETYHTVRKGDTLWIISRSYLGAGIRYTVIFEANRDKIKNPNLIFPDQRLKVPVTKN